MPTVYGVANEDGYPITDGLQEHEALRVAQQISNDRGESVWLCEHDPESDEPWPEGEEIKPQS